MEEQIFRHLSEVLISLIRTPGKLGDPGSVLQHIAETAKDAFGTDICVMLAFNPITGRLIGLPTTVGNLREKDEILHDRPRPEGLTQLVLKEGEVYIEDLEDKPEYHNRLTRKEGIHGVVGLALRTRHRKRPLGVIYLNYRRPRVFGPAERESFGIFAIEASLLLQETWLAHNYEEVARIGQEVNQNLSTVEELFQVLTTFVDSILDNSHTLLLAEYQPQTDKLEIHMRWQENSICVTEPFHGAYKYVLETQKPLFIRHYSKEVGEMPFKSINTTVTEEKESFIFVPLLLRDARLGVLSVQHVLPEAYGQDDLFILQLLANYISLALHNMHLYHSLNQLNETGQLLTLQLQLEQTLQATANKIREATQADLVLLYPYESTQQRFILPPHIAGKLYNSNPRLMVPARPNDVVALALQLHEPIFAKESSDIYAKLHSSVRILRENFQDREGIQSTAVIPLQAGDERVGVLFINFRQPQRFDAPQKLFVTGLTHYAAIAIKNAQTFGSLSLRRIRELEIFQNIDRELNRTLELKSVLNTLLELANEQVHSDGATILLYNHWMQTLEPAAAIGRHAESGASKRLFHLYEAKGITRWAMEQKKPARVGNVHSDPLWKDLYVQTTIDTISELDVPLLDDEEMVGVLNFESTRADAFNEEDELFLVTLAGHAVLAIKKAQAYEREKRLAEEGRGLNEISRQITSQLNYDLILDLILEKALELTHSHMGNLMLYDRDLNDLWMATESGVAPDKKGKRQTLDQGIVGCAAKGKQLLNVRDVTQPPWNEIFMDYILGTRSELAVPILAANELLGVINVESPLPRNFDESDERLLKGLADLAAIALQNAEAFKREKRLAKESQRLAQESQLLNEISREITGQLDHTRVFNLILDKSLTLTDSTLGSLHFFNEELQELQMVADRGVDLEKKHQRQKLGEGIVGYAAEKKRLLNVPDVTCPPWNNIYIEFASGARSELAVPMLAGHQLRGVLNIENPLPNKFTEHDERLMQELADLAVVALQHSERYEQAQKEAQRFALLYQAGWELSRITNVEQLDQAYEIVAQLAQSQKESQVVIYRFDDIDAEFVLKCASPKTNLFERIKKEEGLNGQVAREVRTIVVHDADHLPPGITSIKQSDPDMHSFVVTPIIFEGRYYGNLGLRHDEVGHFLGTDIQFFEGLAQQLASTIYRVEIVQARQEFEQRAMVAEEMSLIGEIAFGLTHRLENDIGLVEAYIDDVREELKSHQIKNRVITRQLENIRRAVRKVLDLSEALKDALARSGEAMNEEPVAVAPRDLFVQAKLDVAQWLTPAIALKIQIEDDVAQVRALPRLVVDILHNLIVNAIQAMSKRGKITLKARNLGRFVALDVSDTGIGIAPEKQTKIFSLFYTTKRSFGFGLWNARRNALKNGGDLTVLESQPGRGTTFRLLLPKADGESGIALR